MVGGSGERGGCCPKLSISGYALLCLQPVDNQQALVRRESVVNLENFKKQYVRRRWKVRQGSGVGGCGWGVPCSLQGLCAHSHLALPLLPLPQLSFSIVSLCNHLTRTLMKKVHLRPDDSLVNKGSAFFWGGTHGGLEPGDKGEQVDFFFF